MSILKFLDDVDASPFVTVVDLLKVGEGNLYHYLYFASGKLPKHNESAQLLNTKYCKWRVLRKIFTIVYLQPCSYFTKNTRP
jgi:hypothetical protein